MLKGLIDKAASLASAVGDSSERERRKLAPIVQAVNALEPEMERRTDAELRASTDRFRRRLASGETLDDLIVEAFATVREVAKRTVDMRPFDVQLIGGIVLHQGKVAEMKTGEGKTLVATMPICLNALSGRGVHLVTVNDYLARRDSLWMGPIYHLLGLSVGLLQAGAEQPAYLYDPGYQRDPYPGLRPVPRKEAYAADVTYGTNNEFGFDYLRDNLALTLERRVQRPLYYAIVDEVDNILIDEARTPLIISGPSDEPVEEYSRFAAIARKLELGVHYELDEKEHAVYLTDEGLAVIEEETGIENIYDEANYRYVHYMQQALKAQVLFLEGRDYLRQRKQIILVDQHTGRLMPNRRLSEGLHQAIEAKEGVLIRPRDVTSATITIQNYFRMYKKLAGMSGTAITEAEEFFKIYNLDVASIPTNKPAIRADHPDVVYRSEEAKLRAVAREILACHSRGQPVLVGTTSVEMSERLSKRLTGERLQMAALAPRVAYALQDADISRDERAELRATMNDNLETINPAAWRRTVRALGLEPNALSEDNLNWIADYLQLPSTPSRDPAANHTLEQALRDGIPHQVLNAKEHTREALIIARAGEPGTVTIATNMAGRGVDIKLGGELTDEVIHKAHQTLLGRGLNPFEATPGQMDSAIAEVTPQYAKRRERVLAEGGLHILGTERHEARRIDNQLRGRSGRQGEPGASRFYLSLEDDLMRRFGRKEMLNKLMQQIGDDFPIEHGLVSKTIERAQTSVEGYNFDIRKHLLEYDDVLNRQRQTIYDERLRILKSHDLRPEVWRMLEGQVDEYLEKWEDPEQQRLLFAGLDDVVPLSLPAPSAPFQGPLTFSGHLTAFPPFTISFLADQFTGQSLAEVRSALQDLAYRAAVSHGEQIRHTVHETTQATLDKYEERLDRYRALLDEKIDDFVQLAEERGQPMDARRLAQHLERTFPLKLTTPRESAQFDEDDVHERLRPHWLAEVELDFHRQTCNALLDRVQIRLPADVRLDRLRPARLVSDNGRATSALTEEMRRVLELAAKQPRDEDTRRQLEQLTPPADPDVNQVMAFVSNIKQTSTLDFGRLDRLVGHVLGAYLDDLLGQSLQALGDEQGDARRLRRELERLRDSVVEGKKGARPNHLLGVLRELNELVHLDIPVVEDLLSPAVAHEYDKWAQRQLTEIEADAERNQLRDTSWTAIAEHLLTSHYTQRQLYDREHRRRMTWMPRLPFGFLAQAYFEGIEVEALRDEILASLRWAIEQREQTWGQQELQRWGHLSLDDLNEETYDGLLGFLGEQELADIVGPTDDVPPAELQEQPVESLPPDLQERLHFILALRRWELHDLRLGDLPQADLLLDQLGRALEEQILNTPMGELSHELQQRIGEHLRQAGLLDDPVARDRLQEQPIREWDQRTREEVARFWGRQVIAANKGQPLAQLEPEVRRGVVAYLQSQRRFVDEERVQHFLVYQRLSDLPPETQQAALYHLARSRLDRLGKRKISNLDVSTRQVVVDVFQRQGLFTDPTRRDALVAGTLAGFDPEIRSGFGAYLARQQMNGHRLSDLEANVRHSVIEQLKQTGVLVSPTRKGDLAARRLAELDGSMAAQVREDLVRQLRTDLANKTMEDLPVATRQQIHRLLDEHNYFIDREKVGWYERKTLAQLSPGLLRGLEEHLGRIRLAELANIPFRELPPEVQDNLLAFIDSAGLLSDRAERLRLTQASTRASSARLGELPSAALKQIAQHLGRQWLVRIRDRRPPDLPPADREAVWTYLRDQGHFSDEFKEELFAYQRLDEFDAETRRAVEASLVEQLTSSLDTQRFGDLSPELQTTILARLTQADYFVDEALLRQIEETPHPDLPTDLRRAVEIALGSHLLAGLHAAPVAQLPAETQAALWSFLDEIGFFVDEQKRNQLLDRRLADVRSDLLETVVTDLAQHLEQEIRDRAVSELDDDLRQGLREALETLGYFESDEVRAQVMSQPLGNLRREELEALAARLGEAELEAKVTAGDARPSDVVGSPDAGRLPDVVHPPDAQYPQRLADLPEVDREAVLAHLQARDWFLDRNRLEKLQSMPLRALEASQTSSIPLHQELVDALREQQIEQLRRQRLADLDRSQRHMVHELLRQAGVVLEENEMRTVRRQRLGDLDPGVYQDWLRDLGEQIVAEWGSTRFQNLDQAQQARLGAFLGRRIMARIERLVLLHTISRLWIDYLTDIEDLRRGIGLEAYGQRDPLVEYKRRAFALFEELGTNIRRAVVRSLFRQPPEPLGAQQGG